MKKFFWRIYQFIFKLVAYFLPWRKPILLSGAGAVLKVPEELIKIKVSKVLVVTDLGIVKTGLMEPLLNELKKNKIEYVIYDKTVPNPTITNIEEATIMYHQHSCQALIGFGGGTAIDCAKGVGAKIVRPKKPIAKMKGVLKVGKRLPPLFAIPTTAGTGSEATLAAVVTNSQTHEKYAINDVVLIPKYAVHDPLLTVNLPKHLTSTTGMDALTHAVEAYIGNSNTKATLACAKVAITLIFENLEKTYQDGKNVEAREKMLLASYYAGLAFTRAYVGNVHAMAHTFGGFYQVPHGLANAIILPYVLDYYGKKASKKLSQLADLVKICDDDDSEAQKAQKFIKEIMLMNQRMNIPNYIMVPNQDNIPTMIKRAYQEANPLYPVPMMFDKKDFAVLFNKVIKFEGDNK
ncbi:MAG: iron-containing alcohol dehydrogenase [Bacilli bacterium]